MGKLLTPIISIVDNDIDIHEDVESAILFIDGEEWLLEENLEIFDRTGSRLKYVNDENNKEFYLIENTGINCEKYLVERLQRHISFYKDMKGEFVRIPCTLSELLNTLRNIEKKHQESSFVFKLKKLLRKVFHM